MRLVKVGRPALVSPRRLATGYDEATVKRVEHLLYIAEYKRRQAAPGPNVTKVNFGRDRRYPITNGWRNGG